METRKDSSQTKCVKYNRLINESSPYLLQHATNPINWYPWGEEAFARAKKEAAAIIRPAPYTESMVNKHNRATAYVCTDFICKLPTADIDQMLVNLQPARNECIDDVIFLCNTLLE
ncbi:MAG: DUF255 domain-containing protein [Desulfobacterales bacterium]